MRIHVESKRKDYRYYCNSPVYILKLYYRIVESNFHPNLNRTMQTSISADNYDMRLIPLMSWFMASLKSIPKYVRS